MLCFSGIGGAFNGKLGNNSAFIKKGKSLFIIDCGGTVFSRLEKSGLLKDIENIYIAITHTHLDHIGSLGDLILYCHHILKGKVSIFFPEKNVIEGFLKIAGVEKKLYKLYDNSSKEIKDKHLGSLKIDFKETSHVEKMNAFGIFLECEGRKIYYSGDSKELKTEIVHMLRENEIEAIYQDTFSKDFEGNAHLSLKKLKEIVPVELRNKVFSMHLDKDLDINNVISEGFNVVNIDERIKS